MAEQIPYGVASSLITRLASAAFHEIGRIYGVKDELERLKNTVESISAVLLDAEEKQEKNHAVKIWIRRLKDDVLYPADNLLDEFFIEDTKHQMDKARKNKVTKVFSSLSPNRIAFRRKMVHEIETIQKKLNDVTKDMLGLNLNSNIVVVEQTNNVKREWRESDSFVLKSNIIGREDDRKKIIRLLKQPYGDQNVSMIAIIGIGGLGKTTLAQLVYNDDEVTNYFEKCMWICVSDNFDVKTIVKKMLELLTNDDKIDDKLSLEHLQNMLREKINAKRYFLVLDDIWNESYEKWAQLRNYLMCGAHGSKVVVTTRSKIVAQTMGVSDSYVLNGLTTEESWDLLKNIITYGYETKEVNRALESIGKKIAEKCTGVPLAVRTLGGLLQGKSEEKEWLDILHGEFWKLCADEESIMKVLKLSYQNLSPQQRQCFAYCSLFPKDHEFRKDDLIQMWKAQGYLECSVEDQCNEDVGCQIVNNFLMKSFFQDAKMNEDGDITDFKMHDLMHDLAIQVAGNDCCYLDSKAKKCVGKPVHVSVEFDAFFLLQSLDACRLRTLIIWPSDDSKILVKDEWSIILNFKYLRVLKVIMELSMRKKSFSIGNLKHLRYLHGARFDRLGIHGKSICNLVCLQTIMMPLDDTFVLSTKDVFKLINLRHLQIFDWYRGMFFPKWLSSLTNIVEMSIESCSNLRYLPPLERLPFLKSLKLTNMYDFEYIYYEEPILHESFFPSLEILIVLSCEKLRGWRRMGDDSNDINSSHHRLLPHFPCLSKLTILSCHMLTHMPAFPNIKRLFLECSRIKILEATLNIEASQYSTGFPPLSMLKSLQMCGTSFNNYCWDVGKIPKNWLQSLTSLEYLSFEYLSSQEFHIIETLFKDDDINCLSSLQKITFKKCSYIQALPDWICNISSLQHIKVNKCRRLALLPEGMSCLTNLRTLKIIGCRILAKECRNKTIATWPKIAHIPKIIIR